MDDTPADYGAPVYLRRSHENEHVGKDVVFVDLDEVCVCVCMRLVCVLYCVCVRVLVPVCVCVLAWV
jgi:hypothetical protein